MELQQLEPAKKFVQPITDFAENLTIPELPDLSLASALGVASLIVGGTEVAFAREVARKAGLDPKYIPIVRLLGAREIVSGIGLLTSKNKKPWLWSRVIGDVLGGALLGYAYYNERQPDRRRKIKKAFAKISPVVIADIVSVAK